MKSSSTSRRLLEVPAALLMTGAAVAVPSASAEPAVAVSFAAPQQVITFDTDSPARPHIAGSAYNNNDNDPMTSTTLYDLDAVQDTLVLQSPPNAGTLTTLGSLGINIDNSTGFDISPAGPGHIVTNIPGDTSSKLYTYPSGVGIAVGTGPVLVGNVGNTKLRYAHITVGLAAPAPPPAT